MIYSDRAPELKRNKLGFKYRKGYNSFLWNTVCNEANKRFETKISKCHKNLFIGYDYNKKIIKQEKENAFNANILKIIQFSTCNLNNIINLYKNKKIRILLSNPSHTDKENAESTLVVLYVQIGFVLKKYFKN
ncbi:hypothetical protein [Buchnera aphidicola]|uniref:hypothetical protein n=1 Tax=Buchnera aphidicola TaxID=9 RepID=UPI000AA79C24|nr:hypothetical protein [Buchnera aphidicola]